MFGFTEYNFYGTELESGFEKSKHFKTCCEMFAFFKSILLNSLGFQFQLPHVETQMMNFKNWFKN